MEKLSSVSSSISERTKSTIWTMRSLLEEIVQWRRPVLSSYYLMATNAAFWASAFYLDESRQYSLLIGAASVMFVWSVLFNAALATVNIVPNTQRSYKKWFGVREGGESGDLVQRGSIVAMCLVPFETIAFVLESFFVPMFSFTYSLLSEHPIGMVIMTGSSVAVHFLDSEEHRKACWTAYATVFITTVIPPWRYNGVTEQIVAYLLTVYSSTRDFLVSYIFYPIFRLLRSVFYALRYCICGYWIPPLIAAITSVCQRIWSSIRRYVVDPIGRVLAYLKRQIVYWACGHWIPPLMEYLSEKKRRLFDWIDRKIVQPVTTAYNRVRQFCIYWFGGYWIAPFRQYCADKRDELILAFYQYVVNPIIAFFADFTNNMKYILLGRWIPPFTAWFYRRVIEPIVRGVVHVYEWADYIFCGRWVPGLLAYLRRKATEAKSYADARFRRLCTYFIRRAIETRDYAILCARRTRDYCRDLAIRTAIYVRTNILVPFVAWLKEARVRLRIWFVNRVLIPAWDGTKAQWRRFKYYVKHHVLYPALRRAAYLCIAGIVYAWQNGVVPVLNVVGEHAARGKEFARINWGEPAMDWLARNMPEKSPFVDDSDTELKDFLPEEEEEDEITMEADDDSDNEVLQAEREKRTAELPSTSISGQSDVVRLKLPASVRSFVSSHLVGSSSEEEDEFSIGLNFPAVEHADSDEEEERRMIPRKHSSASSTSSLQRQKQRKLSGASSSSSTSRRKLSPGGENISPTKPQSPPSINNSSQSRTTEKALPLRPTSSELEPDFEMVDHNEVDD